MKFSQVYSGRHQAHSEGFRTWGYPIHWGTNLSDPILSVDHFAMKEPFFPPHPHAGFSAVTYVLPRSRGALMNRDSRGDRSAIAPGDLHWTLAARGVIHEEVPESPGEECEGLQVFVNLSQANKGLDPKSFHLRSDEIPMRRSSSGSALRVLLGEAQGLTSSLPLPEPISFFHLSLMDADEMGVPVKAGQGGVILSLSGTGIVTSQERRSDARVLGAHQILAFRSKENREIVVSGQGDWVVLLGEYRDEPVVAQGPFIMTSEDEIREALRRYRSGEMGELRPSFSS